MRTHHCGWNKGNASLPDTLEALFFLLFIHFTGSSCVKLCVDQLTKGPPTTQIRLKNGSSQFEGRVEVNHNGVWGTVCDDSWGITDAQVVCRELLLGGAREAVSYGELGKGQESQPIWLSMVIFLGQFLFEGSKDHGSTQHYSLFSRDVTAAMLLKE